ncbi:hypothetical protein HHI36_022236, partial [Cryptolaemus montrouzieri]
MESGNGLSKVEGGTAEKTAKKGKKSDRILNVMNILRASTNEVRLDYECHRLRCFENVNEANRRRILKEFYGVTNYDNQNRYLGGLITFLPIMRRQNRQNSGTPNLSSYSYRVKMFHDGDYRDVQ